MKEAFQSYVKLFKHSLFDLSKCFFLKWLKVKCFDNLILDLSNGHNCLHVSFFLEMWLDFIYYFSKNSNHLKKTKFGQGLIPQTLIQRFGMLKDFQLSKWVQLGSQGIASLLFSQSHKLHVGMCLNILACQFSPLFNMIPIERVSTFFVSRTFCCLT